MSSTAPLWPLAPNWRESYSVSYEFKTDIFTSRSGREQRRAQRTTPRRALKFTVSRTELQARTFSRFLALYQGPAINVADSSRFARTTADVSVGATVLTLDSAEAGWLAGGETVVLYFDGAYSAAKIQSVDQAAAIAHLIDPLNRDWPSGTKVHPLLVARLDDNISVKNYHRSTIEADLNFRVEPALGLADDTGSPTAVFNDREVFTFDPNFADAVQGDVRRAVDVVDFGRGRTTTYLPVAFSSRTKQFQMLLPSQSRRTSVIQFFERMKGQRGEFYMPSYEDDFALVSAGAMTATFAGTDLDDVYRADDVHRAVEIITGTGLRFYRRIVGSSVTNGATTLTTDVPWPAQLNAATRISWLLVHRFATDQLTVDCQTDEVSKIQVSVTSLEDLQVSATDAVFAVDGAAHWVLDNWGLEFADMVFDPLEYVINSYAYLTLTIGYSAIRTTGVDGLNNVFRKYRSIFP